MISWRDTSNEIIHKPNYFLHWNSWKKIYRTFMKCLLLKIFTDLKKFFYANQYYDNVVFLVNVLYIKQ